MSKSEIAKWWFVLAAALFVIWLAFGVSIVNATDRENGDVDIDISGGDTVVTGGDVSVPVDVSSTGATFKSRAYGLSNSLGDVDIAGCLGSTQWNTPFYGKQKLVLNWPCITEFYLRNAMWENAAMAICNTEVRAEFETEQDCRDAHPFALMSNESSNVDESENEDEELVSQIIEQQATIDVQQRSLETVNERLKKLERTKRAAPKVVNQVGLTDYQREELAKVFKK